MTEDRDKEGINCKGTSEAMVCIPRRLLDILSSRHADYAAWFCREEYPEFEGMELEDTTFEDVLAALRELSDLRSSLGGSAKPQRSVLEAQRAAWEAEWPNHCRTCGGTGCAAMSVQDENPGDTVCDVCEDCGIYDPRCPRCGRRFEDGHFEGDDYVAGKWDEWMESGKPCPSCGFTHGKGD